MVCGFFFIHALQEKPYVMVKDDKNLTGNARYEGFCIDLLKRISGLVGFQYSIRLVPDHMYGVYDPETKTWNGIVRELMERVSIPSINNLLLNLNWTEKERERKKNNISLKHYK